ncbi:hypothetical protein J4T96_gp092 [Mycobacterium phage Finemlucis]|uniref:Uncharacterized protein n=1 Tax=Mycobacterium phage Finemlucis TaxID=2015844 RepID=A0A291I9X3_9CAUD|nr:hypothetical protein J4T96_gp092 [Mycobacterium phage Finemlucis]ATG86503.1 hypothetical protein SEA_FINEMLUCIS_92 [Mycobacterium phage Finemlucis]AYN57136.1 hypothetical protein PBI_BIGCHEESE_91 [Mycobacterium phage BigCheese]QGJ93963.1 hypothetical protein SEA_BOBSGARAGE_90 [Mycobacterium phage BobsGarage]
MSVKAPTLNGRKGDYAVQPHEVARAKVLPTTLGEGEVLTLTDAERKAARKAIGQIHANLDVKLQAVLDAINHVRSNDPVGTLRKNSKGVYAFSFEPGKWLLIDVDKPAYRAAESPADNAAIQNSWELVVSG